MRSPPERADLGIAHRWAGLYEVTPDHNGLVGAAEEVPGVVYCTGFSGHGFLLGPALGEVMTSLVLGRAPLVDVSGLDVRRFAGDTPRPETAVL